MNTLKSLEEYHEEEDAIKADWILGDYTGCCPKCGRQRLCICPNGKHRCEKCNWCPENNSYAPINNF